ncbi:MAG TPA: alpha-(1-_3)-arabinofuranosyltransferase family protein, partial [Streptosporangiaceae bacterium]|nr:alpha-(1->3)-arabinofuranosyltransferase family protein [Streptosporangiaceae bacterium]
MTTLQLPDQDLTGYEPGSSAGGGHRPRWLRGGWGDAAERAGRRWLLLVWGLALIALLLTHPGRMTFDTKLGVDIDPVGFYQRLWHLWNPLEWQGSLQDQYIGYAFPMGLYYLVAHELHIPVWVTERLWMSILIAVGFWGLVRLAEAVGIGTRPTRLLAGAAFALWPTYTILVGSTSAALLPGVFATWAVLPLVRYWSATVPVRNQISSNVPWRPPAVWSAAARSGLFVACMGGVNAASTLAALVLPGMYILTRTGRRRWILLGWEVLAVLLATAWWLVPLLYQGRYGFNFLPYIEQATNTTQTVSADAVLRGAGNWVAYLNFGVPWLTAGSVMVAYVWPVAAASVASGAGLAGLARRDLPEAIWLRWTVLVAALWGLTGYAGPLGGPLHRQIQDLLNGPLSALRNVYKIEPVLAAALALGVAHVLARGVWRRPAHGELRGQAARGLAVIITVAAAGGLCLPFLNGQILQPGSFAQIPTYWKQAAAFMASHAKDQTTLVVPADSHGIYTWGQPIDEPLEPLASSPWTEASLVPYSGGGASALVDGAEQAIESGSAQPGLAAYLARAGVRYILVRNDLDPAQLGYVPPAVVHASLQQSGFTRVASFGTPLPVPPAGQGTSLQVQAITPAYAPVEIYQARNPADQPSGPVSVLPTSSTALVDGGPAALQQLEAQGLLGDRPAIVAGQGTKAEPAASSQDVTDGLRRADTVFGLPNNNTSYTYTASGTNPPDDPLGAAGQAPRQLLPAGTAGHQTVAVVRGARSVTASSAGSWLWQYPQGDPVNAFDGNPDTAWVEASATSAVGQWLQIDFNHLMDVGTPVNIRLLDDVPRPVATRLTVTSATGHVDTTTRVTGATQKLNIPSGTTSWLRITIDATHGGTAGGPGAGISGIAVPGVWVNRFLQPSQTSSGPAPSLSFQRDLGSSIGLPGSPPEAALNRTFTTSGKQRFQVAGTVAAVPGAQLNSLLASLDTGTPQLTISASSTFGDLPALSPQNLLTGSPVGWVASSPQASLHLKWTGQKSISEIELTAPTVGIAAQPTRALISSPAGTRDVPVPPGGVLHFAPLTTDQLTLRFPGVMPTTAYNPLVGRATQLPVGLAGLTIPALSSLNAGAPTSQTFHLSCGQGPSLAVDGKTYQTSVSGTVADLTSFASLPLHLCTSGTALALPAGRHWLTSPGTGLPLTVTGLSLKNASASAATTSASTTRAFTVKDWGTEHRTGTIAAGAQSYLEVHQAASPGWTAALNGRTLKPVTLDGWQQAFIVPAGAGGTVVMDFTPVNGYHWALVIAFAALAVLLILALWPRRRVPWPRRPDPEAAGHDARPDDPSLDDAERTGAYDAHPGDNDPDLIGPRYPASPDDLDRPRGPRDRTPPIDTSNPTSPIDHNRHSSRGNLTARSDLSVRAYWITVVAATIVLALVGGWLAFVVLGTLLVGWAVPRWVPWVAFLGMCVAGGFAIAELSHGPQHGFGAFGWPAQA